MMHTQEDNSGIPSTPDRMAASRPAEPRWSPWAALVMAWVRPAMLARRTNHVPLWQAYLVHLTAVLLGVVLILLLVAWADSDTSPLDVIGILLAFVEIVEDVVREWQTGPQDFSLWVLGTFLVIEGSAMATAFLASGWAAADEPFRRSLAAGVRRTWLGTSLLLPAILFVGIVGTTVSRLANDWYQSDAAQWPEYPAYPQQPLNLKAGTPEWKEYQQQVKEWSRAYQQAQSEYEKSQPWCVRHAQTLIGTAFALALSWAIWTWLRGASAERGLPPCDHPPLCEGCGYNLTHAPADGRCSECGRAVEESLGPNVRRGSPWEHRAVVGCWAAWRQCAWEAMLRPAAFGRRLRLRTRVTAHGSYLATCIPLLIVFAWAGWLGFYAAIERDSPFGAGDRDVVGVFAMAAVFTTAFLVAVLCLAAWATGTGFAYRDRRNLLPVTIQAAAYLGPYLVLWTLFAGFAAVAVVLLEPVYRDVGDMLGFNRLMGFGPFGLQLLSWLLANVACVIVYVHHVVRITSGARYANR
ncbi:MAG: hypothetical protein JXB13_18170 [Phycisphaerae bacterium]|nr:hypothetical protein [Phycisphaerae bacterium]